MASDQKPPSSMSPSATQSLRLAEKGIRIFSYPKLIFMFPTLIASLICGVGMLTIGDRPIEQKRAEAAIHAGQTKAALDAAATNAPAPHERFKTQENLLGVLFLGVFAFNLLMMAIDFPRFSIVAIAFLTGFVVFFFLWLGAYFDIELMRYVHAMMAKTYVYANAQFYFMVAGVLAVLIGVIWATRWLDYWQILPNEILHHHGPLSDLERFPTMNLKFDKEIPDVLEYMFLGSGKLVLHVTEERKAIVLENVLFINSVERALKNLMSRMEVRLTTDQEVADL